jgi:NADP-dependent 3-hydroxy acid dehydrogenase YdfG
MIQKDMNSFAGKVVLIIGGTSGIGRATAIAFTEPPTMFSSRIRLISATVALATACSVTPNGSAHAATRNGMDSGIALFFRGNE